MNGRGDAAEAGLARVVEPTKAEIIHPPDLWTESHRDADADRVEVREGIVQVDGYECAIA